MELSYVINFVEKERDKLFKENMEANKLIKLFSDAMEVQIKKCKDNQIKMNQLDNLLDNYIYKKEEPS